MVRAISATVWLLIAGTLCAQRLTVELDPAKTTIHWTLSGNIHTVHGTFRLKRGQVTVDTSSGSVTGDAVVDASSGESGNGARDKRMHKEILESERFPEIKLTPFKVEGQLNPMGRSTVRLSGTFLIHGRPHQLSIPLDVTLSGTDVIGTSKFSVPYVAWGMKNPSNFLFKVDKAVEVQIVAAGTLTPK